MQGCARLSLGAPQGCSSRVSSVPARVREGLPAPRKGVQGSARALRGCEKRVSKGLKALFVRVCEGQPGWALPGCARASPGAAKVKILKYPPICRNANICLNLLHHSDPIVTIVHFSSCRFLRPNFGPAPPSTSLGVTVTVMTVHFKVES